MTTGIETESAANLRSEARSWIRKNLPKEWRAASAETIGEENYMEIRRAWAKKLYEAGWVGLSWAKEYGGKGLSLVEEVVFAEEEALAQAPDFISRNSVYYIGPTIIAHGNEEQKRRYLPKMLSAEEVWCQGYSEPNAGSDLASLRTAAMKRDGRWIVNGQKTWTTIGNHATWCYFLARTDPSAPKHKGITAFVVDMKTKGITVRPITTITGSTEFSEMFFDDVEVPEENVLGALNQGWKVTMTTLGFERSMNNFARAVLLRSEVEEVARLARRTRRHGRPAIEDGWIAQRLAQCAEEAEALRLTIHRYLPKWAETHQPGPESSVIKIMWSEAHQRLMELALEVLGPGAQLRTGPDAEAKGRWPMMYLFTRAETIYAGTSEIQRNVVAERMLGMPRAKE
ncbi:MAG: acyl-CoA dehydrogenase family protein [Nitrospirae bacterium]|nr:acyl-CoA dehydrogenase family protein [Nitrospirota bacterium]